MENDNVFPLGKYALLWTLKVIHSDNKNEHDCIRGIMSTVIPKKKKKKKPELLSDIRHVAL